MTTLGYSQLSTDELVQKFIDGAKRTGTVFSIDRKMLLQSVASLQARHSESGVEEMQALGAELRRRRPIMKLRQLFDDPNRDVRGWAAPQFVSVDYEWATATLTGLTHGLSTREVLAWRERVLHRPPGQPALKDMSGAQLLERYIDACERCYGATRFLTDEQGGGTNMKAYNKVSSEAHVVAKELQARGKLQLLIPLFEHPCVTVREKAAMHCLDIASDKAAAVLEGIDGPDCRHEAAEGTTMLALWQWGKYKPLSK